MMWQPSRDRGGLDCLDERRQLVGAARLAGLWEVYGPGGCQRGWAGTLEAAKAAVEAELWARAAERLGQR